MQELASAVAEIVEMVCTSMLGLEVLPGEARSACPGERALVGCVQLTGSWSGAVLVSCTGDFAQLVAQLIFGATTASSDEERDALGEITNMIAGNLKTLLPSPSFLGLPTVSDSVDGVLEVMRSHVVEKFDLRAAGHPVSVVLITRAPS